MSGAGFREGLLKHESGPADGVINSPDEARFAVRWNIKYGADVIKTCATGGVLSPTDDVDVPQLTQAELDALVTAAHELRRKTAAHAHGAEGAKRAIRAGIDSIEHGTFLDDEALQMMHDRGTYLVPTLSVRAGLAESKFPPLVQAKVDIRSNHRTNMVRRALKHGVKIALGTDAAVYPHGDNALEFVLMANDGMTPAQSLRPARRSRRTCSAWRQSRDSGSRQIRRRRGSARQSDWQHIKVTQSVFFVMKDGTVYRNDRLPIGTFTSAEPHNTLSTTLICDQGLIHDIVTSLSYRVYDTFSILMDAP